MRGNWYFFEWISAVVGFTGAEGTVWTEIETEVLFAYFLRFRFQSAGSLSGTEIGIFFVLLRSASGPSLFETMDGSLSLSLAEEDDDDVLVVVVVLLLAAVEWILFLFFWG